MYEEKMGLGILANLPLESLNMRVGGYSSWQGS
jgi:hypothetical protein